MKRKTILMMIALLILCVCGSFALLAGFGWQNRERLQELLGQNGRTRQEPPTAETHPAVPPLPTATVQPIPSQSTDTSAAPNTATETVDYASQTPPVSETPPPSATHSPTPTRTKVFWTRTPVNVAVCNPGEWLGCGGDGVRVSCASSQVGYCGSSGQWVCVPDPAKCGQP